MSFCFKTACRLLLSVAALALATSAQAATYRWSFKDLSFFDGGKAYGTFYSNGTSFYNWDITTYWDPATPGFPEMVSPYHYTSATSSLEAGSTFRLLRSDTTVAGNYLELSFSETLDRAGVFEGSALERTESYGGSVASHSGIFDVRSVGRPVRPPRQRGGRGFGPADEAGLTLFSGEEVLVATPVPEPQTYAMAMFGFLLIGAAVKRQKNQQR